MPLIPSGADSGIKIRVYESVKNKTCVICSAEILTKDPRVTCDKPACINSWAKIWSEWHDYQLKTGQVDE